jgi:SAM-dependent methyltransferase
MDSASHRQDRDSWTTRLISGGIRKTRLHDELGALVPLPHALRNGPRALGTGMLRLLFGYRPALPWISYDAQRILARFLTDRSEVLEFGSGMSTLWYAGKAGHVVSIEDDEAWYAKVSARLSAAGNIDYRFAPDPASYVGLAPDKPYDLIMIDGSWREDCARFAVRHLKPGGVIYLDNSDKGPNMQVTGDIPAARAFLLEFAAQQGLPSREITDFAPTQLFVQRGLMIGGS